MPAALGLDRGMRIGAPSAKPSTTAPRGRRRAASRVTARIDAPGRKKKTPPGTPAGSRNAAGRFAGAGCRQDASDSTMFAVLLGSPARPIEAASSVEYA